MKTEFVPYEQALALKELGFDEPCMAWATMEYKGVVHCGIRFKIHKEVDLPTKPFGVPTWQSAFRWFREKYGLDFGIGKIYNGTDNYHYYINLEWQYFEGNYEEAELACLIKLIEIVKEKL
jgi:hypothetical protein